MNNGDKAPTVGVIRKYEAKLAEITAETEDPEKVEQAQIYRTVLSALYDQWYGVINEPVPADGKMYNP